MAYIYTYLFKSIPIRKWSKRVIEQCYIQCSNILSPAIMEVNLFRSDSVHLPESHSSLPEGPAHSIPKINLPESKHDCEQQNSNVGKDVFLCFQQTPNQQMKKHVNERIIHNIAHQIVESLPLHNVKTWEQQTNNERTARQTIFVQMEFFQSPSHSHFWLRKCSNGKQGRNAGCSHDESRSTKLFLGKHRSLWTVLPEAPTHI